MPWLWLGVRRHQGCHRLREDQPLCPLIQRQSQYPPDRLAEEEDHCHHGVQKNLSNLEVAPVAMWPPLMDVLQGSLLGIVLSVARAGLYGLTIAGRSAVADWSELVLLVVAVEEVMALITLERLRPGLLVFLLASNRIALK